METLILNLIKDLLRRGNQIELSLDERGEICYVLYGFYKSSSVKITQNENGDIICTSRYSEVTILDNGDPLRSLAYLNFEWWKRSKGRYDGWGALEPLWADLMIEYGWIKKEEKIVVSYKEN